MYAHKAFCKALPPRHSLLVLERGKRCGWILVDMQPGTNFSAIDDLAHANGVDLHIAGHVHIYQ